MLHQALFVRERRNLRIVSSVRLVASCTCSPSRVASGIVSTRLAVLVLLVGPPVLGQVPSRRLRESLCGRVYDRPPTIEAESIGPIHLRASTLDLKRSCLGARDTSDDFLGQGFLVWAFGSRVEVLGDQGMIDNPSDRVVNLIRVSGGNRIRMREGIGPGSTIHDAKRALGDLQVAGCQSGVSYAWVVRRPGLGLRFSATCSRGVGEMSTYSDTAIIQAVEVFIPVD